MFCHAESYTLAIPLLQKYSS